MSRWLLACLSLSACGTTLVDEVRFKNQPPITVVDDRRDVPCPHRPGFALSLYMMDDYAFRRLTRLMEIPESRRAADVNALDDVPDSTWYTNRTPTADEVRRGPNTSDGPDPSGPWTVLSTKVGGRSAGLVIQDAKGTRFVLKFDKPGLPDAETGTDVVGQRLLWALGYNTPEDSVVFFTRSQLSLSPKAVVKDFFDNTRPMTMRDLDDTLARADRMPGGEYRGLASKFLEGKLLDGFWPEGLRADDPNDLIAHEDRREVRAQGVFFAWLNHTDVKPDNTLDVWNGHFVVHYLIDFGQALGLTGDQNKVPSDGFSHMAVDFEYFPLSLLSLGLWRRPWEGADGPAIRGVGRFESEHFDPGHWKAQYPYLPFERVDRFDGYWAAKKLMQLGPEHLRAAVLAARFAEPRAVDYLTRVLVERQRRTAAYWFARVSPLDRFRMEPGGLCFDDLWIQHALGGGETHYEAIAFDWSGRPTGWRTQARERCLSGIAPAGDHDGYTIVSLRAVPDGRGLPPVLVHLGQDPQSHALRVIGVRRL